MTDVLKLRAIADRSYSWAKGDSVRYIVATIEAPASSDLPPAIAPPVHLAIVIDASGSMEGDNLDSAKSTALGIVERLRDNDRLSIISFGSEAFVLVDGLRLSPQTRSIVTAAIRSLEPRGNSELSEGWLLAAERIAAAMEEHAVNRIILLSDGKTNGGLMKPLDLARHSFELASRGVFTSALGIGDGYDVAVLQTIAENGGGRLHDAEYGVDILDALMGDLANIGKTAAEAVTVRLSVPATARALLVGTAPVTVGMGTLSVFVGSLMAGRARDVVFRVTLPAGQPGDLLPFEISASGRCPSVGAVTVQPGRIAFTSADGALNSQQPWETRAAQIVAKTRYGHIVQTASRLHRAGDRTGTLRFIDRELKRFQRYCEGLPGTTPFVMAIERLRRYADEDWGEATRKKMEAAYFRAEPSPADLQSMPRAFWSDRAAIAR